VDRRFGEQDPALSAEDKMVERFARERQVPSHPRSQHLGASDAMHAHHGRRVHRHRAALVHRQKDTCIGKRSKRT
jgi:hypothetical protein